LRGRRNGDSAAGDLNIVPRAAVAPTKRLEQVSGACETN
jgi:hypothetical protein